MIARSHPIAELSVRSRAAMAGLVILFGMLLVGGAGFVQADALHKAAHDTRHAFGLPCH